MIKKYYLIYADEILNNDLMNQRKTIHIVKVYNDKSKYRMIIKDLDINKTMSLDISDIVKDLKKER